MSESKVLVLHLANGDRFYAPHVSQDVAEEQMKRYGEQERGAITALGTFRPQVLAEDGPYASTTISYRGIVAMRVMDPGETE